MDFVVRTSDPQPQPQFIEFEIAYCDDSAVPLTDTQGGIQIAVDKVWASCSEVAPTRAGFVRFSGSINKSLLAKGLQTATVSLTIPSDSSCGTPSVKTFPINATLIPGKKFK